MSIADGVTDGPTWYLYTVRPLFLSGQLRHSSRDIRSASKVDAEADISIALGQNISNIEIVLAELVVSRGNVGSAEFDIGEGIQTLEQ